jgi:hypothetical protein
MTDQEWQDIGRRAVACKHWRWMPGMLARYSADAWYRTSEVDSVGIPVRVRPPNPRSAWPDLRDPATVGCLLALVREACEPNRAPGDWPMVCTYQSQAKKWGIGAWLNESGKATFAALVLPAYDTEADALVAALEAAP